jgi:conjugal transfer ATP-binding protein TraC
MINLASAVGKKISSFLKERTDYGVSTESPSISQLNQFFETFSMGDLLPYRSYDPSEQIFYNENSVGFVLETNPLVGCTEEMQREISGLFQHTLPEGVNIQFTLWADPRVGSFLEKWANARKGHGEVFEALAKRRADHIGKMVFDDIDFAPPRNFRCIISFSKKGDLENPVEQEKFFLLREQIKTSLKTLGVGVKVWSADDLLSTLDGILNFNKSVEPADLKWNPYDSLAEQVPARGNSLQVLKKALCINEGEGMIRTYSVRREPELWSLHAMGDLIGDTMRDVLQISCPFLISYGIHISDQEKTKLRVQSRESWVEKQARSRIGKKIPILMKQSRELDFVRHQQGKGERFVQSNFTVTIFGNKENFDKGGEQVTNLFRSNRWQLQGDPYIQLPMFLSTFPMA